MRREINSVIKQEEEEVTELGRQEISLKKNKMYGLHKSANA